MEQLDLFEDYYESPVEQDAENRLQNLAEQDYLQQLFGAFAYEHD